MVVGMTFADRGILQYESSLSRNAGRRIRQIGSADLLIGIPTHRNGRTVGEVINAALSGIRTYLGGYRIVLMNADGGSSDNTVRHFEDAELPDNVEPLWTEYVGSNGKGLAIRSIFEAASRLKVSACLVMEARAPGIKPEWLPALINPVLQGDQIVMGCYHQSAYDAALTDNLVYPFLRVFLGADLREPLAGEFCVSGELANQLAAFDVWETHVARFGVNVWLAIHALTEHLRLAQVDLGYRGPGGGEPGALADPRFMHTFETLFRLLIVHRRIWMSLTQPVMVPWRGSRAVYSEAPSHSDHRDLLWQAFHNGLNEYLDGWRAILQPETLDDVLALLGNARGEYLFPADLWAKVVYEFATVYNKGEGDPDRAVEALLPLFYARAAAYVTASRGLSPAEREPRVQEVLDAFFAQRPYFVQMWETYQDWDDDVTRYWLS
jgi:glucosylglycerate synthase